MIHCPGIVCVELTKEGCSSEEKRLWWKSAIKGHPEVEADKHDDTPTDVKYNELSDENKRLLAKRVRDRKTMGKKELKMDDMKYEAFAKMETEKSERDKSHAKAMENPKKRDFYNQMKEKFPDIPISFR